MGLDMYLNRKHYVKNWEHNKEKFCVQVMIDGALHPSIKPDRVTYITEEVCYWRKANEIHSWFVDNVQDGEDECRPHYVSREKLTELRDLCRTILSDHSKAAELLPTRSGFFFGSTDYDDGYFEDVEHTEKTLTELLSEPDSGDFEYRSSW